MWKQDILIAWALAAFAIGMIVVASVTPPADAGDAPVVQANVRGAATGVAPSVRGDMELDLHYIRADRAEPY